MIDTTKPPLEEAYLEHFGVKGMKWGVRKDDPKSGFRLQTTALQMDSNIHSGTKNAASDVAALVAERYGFQLSSLKTLGPDHPEYQYGTTGFVQATPGKRNGDIYVRKENLTKDLKDAEKSGWFAKGCGHQHGFLTHEASHALFHADQQVKQGFLGPKVTGESVKARDTALNAAVREAKKEGISSFEIPSKVSGYAEAAGRREEMEAELFTQYHWSPNPPQFVKTWGETLHQELGYDPTPFREVAKRG